MQPFCPLASARPAFRVGRAGGLSTVLWPLRPDLPTPLRCWRSWSCARPGARGHPALVPAAGRLASGTNGTHCPGDPMLLAGGSVPSSQMTSVLHVTPGCPQPLQTTEAWPGAHLRGQPAPVTLLVPSRRGHRAGERPCRRRNPSACGGQQQLRVQMGRFRGKTAWFSAHFQVSVDHVSLKTPPLSNGLFFLESTGQ